MLVEIKRITISGILSRVSNMPKQIAGTGNIVTEQMLRISVVDNGIGLSKVRLTQYAIVIIVTFCY